MSDVTTEGLQMAVEHIENYLNLKAQIAELEAEADISRSAVAQALGTDEAPAGKKWEFPGVGTVAIAKGRVSEKLNRIKLAKAGVAIDVLDAATERKEGKPSMRITAEGEGGGDDAAE